MLKRTSKVDSLKVDSAGLSSVIQIGDSTIINGLCRAIAVQREEELFYSNEGNFDSFGVFSYSFPLQPIDEPIIIHSTSLNPIIKVGTIDLLGITSASIVHIGSSKHVQTESRTLHIRQLQSIRNKSNNASKEE